MLHHSRCPPLAKVVDEALRSIDKRLQTILFNPGSLFTAAQVATPERLVCRLSGCQAFAVTSSDARLVSSDITDIHNGIRAVCLGFVHSLGFRNRWGSNPQHRKRSVNRRCLLAIPNLHQSPTKLSN